MQSLVAALAAEPRPAGSAAEARARSLCRSRLERAGYRCVEQSFEYSEWPGRWGTPLVGALLLVASLLALVASLSGTVALERAAFATVAAAVLAGAVLARRATVWLPVGRRAGVNLVATRGAPAVWLVAHLDSKSQPVAMLLRVAAVLISALLWAALLSFAAAGLGQARGGALATGLAIAASVAALPIVLTTVGSDSDGALDNASGVAAVILAAEAAVASSGVGVVITSAEELGLAGAHAWLSSESRLPGFVINCDGVDDSGDLRCMLSPWSRSLALCCQSAAERCSLATPVRTGRVLPGVLVDGTAFASAGWRAVTVSRGRLSALARIHTRRDVAARLDGRGVQEAALLIAALARCVQGVS